MSNAKAKLLVCTVCCMLLRVQCTETEVWLQQQGDCTSYYTARKPLTADERQAVQAITGSSCPAVLWTYTGTGNTMTRMLIEVASGWHTGSVYTGAKLAARLVACFKQHNLCCLRHHLLHPLPALLLPNLLHCFLQTCPWLISCLASSTVTPACWPSRHTPRYAYATLADGPSNCSRRRPPLCLRNMPSS